MTPSKFFLFFVSTLSLPAVRAANIIDTIYGPGAGSFEIPVPSFDTFSTYPAGSTAITGWTVNTVNIDWVKDSVWNASNGHYSIDMNGTNLPVGTPSSPGGIQTIVPTTIGSTYRVTFDIAGFTAPGNTANPKTMNVIAGGVVNPFSLTTNNDYALPLTLPIAVTWATRTFNFVATQEFSIVSFISTISNDGSAMLLDNVSIEAVPEPSALLMSGIAGMALAARRRRAC